MNGAVAVYICRAVRGIAVAELHETRREANHARGTEEKQRKRQTKAVVGAVVRGVVLRGSEGREREK